jgi:hypothetical protein
MVALADLGQGGDLLWEAANAAIRRCVAYPALLNDTDRFQAHVADLLRRSDTTNVA